MIINKFFLASILINSIYGQNNTIQTGCTTPICVFSNQNLRFGSGYENSINSAGLFVQPWYYSYISNSWYKLTFSNYPLDTAIGSGYGNSHWSGSTVVDLYTLTPSNIENDYSNFIVSSQDSSTTVGYGKIIARRSYVLNNNNIILENTFSLGRNDSFVKTITSIINNSPNIINNLLIWIGTRDDFVGVTDVNTKTRGNLINGSFVAITANDQDSYAIMITNTNEGVLFYSETSGVMTSYAYCCSFSNVYNTNPRTILPSTPSPTDGSYAAVLPLGNISGSGSGNIIWYYAAGAVSTLSSVSQSVATAQIADIVVPTFTSTFSTLPVIDVSNQETSSNIQSNSLIVSPSNQQSNSYIVSPSNIYSNSFIVTSTEKPSNSFLVSPSNIESYSFLVSPSNIESNSFLVSPSVLQSNSLIVSPSDIESYTIIVSPTNIPSYSLIVSSSNIKTYSSYITPSSKISNLFSISSSVSNTPSNYYTISALNTLSSTQTQSKSLINTDKIISVQLNNDIVSNFIVINVVTIFVIFSVVCLLLCCVYGIIIYRKKNNYCEECKKHLNHKNILKTDTNPDHLKLAFVDSIDEVTSVDNNLKIPNYIN